MRKICWAAAAVLALAAAGAFSATAAAQDDGSLDVVKVRRNFYMIAGAGGNIGVQIGSDGIVLVNAGTAAASEKVLAALKKLTDLPIRYIINVDAGPEFVGGNEKLSRAGYTIFTNALGNAAAVAAMTNGGGASILSHDSVLRRMSAIPRRRYSNGAMPSEAFFTPRKALRMNDEGIEVLHQPAAHTNGDSFVLFRSSDVVIAGDILDMTWLPGDRRGKRREHSRRDRRSEQADRADDSADPVHLPGRRNLRDSGARTVYDQTDVVDYRDMIVIVRDV